MKLRFRRLAQEIRDSFGGLVVIGRVGDANVSIVENGVVRSVRLFELVERLRNQKGFDAVAGQERECAFEEFEPAERREFVEDEEKAMRVRRRRADLHRLGEAAADWVQHGARRSGRQCAARDAPRRARALRSEDAHAVRHEHGRDAHDPRGGASAIAGGPVRGGLGPRRFAARARRFPLRRPVRDPGNRLNPRRFNCRRLSAKRTRSRNSAR
jgi:hypothetical protein